MNNLVPESTTNHTEESSMEIINLTEKYHQVYFCCLEEWSDEMKEAGNHKELWYQKMKEKDLGVKLAVEDEKVLGTAHIAVGNNKTYGGTNDVQLHLDGVFNKPTIEVNNKIIMKHGKLLI